MVLLFLPYQPITLTLYLQALHHHTDTELIGFISQDNDLAFTTLYERYWDKLLAIAMNRLHVIEEAEEVVQVVFVNLWQRRKQLSAQLNTKAYLATAVKYEILNRLARQKRFTAYQKHLQHTHLYKDQATQEWLDFEELKELIEKTVKSLPAKCQLVYRLSKEHALSEKEIAQEMNISVKTVESHLSKAIKKLRTVLKQVRYFFISL